MTRTRRRRGLSTLPDSKKQKVESEVDTVEEEEDVDTAEEENVDEDDGAGTAEGTEEEDDEDLDEEENDEEEDLDTWIERLEARKANVEDNTDTEFVSKIQEFEGTKHRALKTAELHLTLQNQNNEDLYAFEVQRAENLLENEKLELKAALLAQTKKRIAKTLKKIESLREEEQTSKTPALPSVTTTPSPPLEKVPAAASTTTTMCPLTPETIRKKTEAFKSKVTASWNQQKEAFNGTSFSSHSHLLASPDDIMKDIHSIYNDWKKFTSSSENSVCREIETQTRDGKLFYRKDIYQPGDVVTVNSKFSGEDYEGVIDYITDDALYLKLQNNEPKVRVYLSHLKSQRCSIKPRTFGPEVLERLAETAWVH